MKPLQNTGVFWEFEALQHGMKTRMMAGVHGPAERLPGLLSTLCVHPVYSPKMPDSHLPWPGPRLPLFQSIQETPHKCAVCRSYRQALWPAIQGPAEKRIHLSSAGLANLWDPRHQGLQEFGIPQDWTVPVTHSKAAGRSASVYRGISVCFLC